MKNVIYQSVCLPATAEELFESYLDPVRHEGITGKPVRIGKEHGAEFEAFDGVLTGMILQVVPSKLIVQSWRSPAFKSDDPDSTLIIAFANEGQEGRIDLVHLDVPDQDYQGVIDGWKKYYWDPWRDYLLK